MEGYTFMWARKNFFLIAMPFFWFDRSLHLFNNIPEQLLFRTTARPNLVALLKILCSLQITLYNLH
jgi:hypothetical protein